MAPRGGDEDLLEPEAAREVARREVVLVREMEPVELEPERAEEDSFES